MHINIVPGWNM